MWNSFVLKMQGVHRSLTIWFNAVVLTMLPFLDTIQSTLKEYLPVVSQWLGSSLLQWAAGLIVVANIFLRFKTTKDLAEK